MRGTLLLLLALAGCPGDPNPAFTEDSGGRFTNLRIEGLTAALADDGTAVAVFTADNNARIDLYAFRPGESPACLGELPSGDPHVAIDADGTAIAIWPEANGIHARVRNGDTPWEEAQRIDTERAFWPRVAMSPSGEGFAVWVRRDTEEIVARRYGAASGWDVGVIAPCDRVAGLVGEVAVPDLAMNPAGTSVVVYEDGNEVRAVFHDGLEFGTPETLAMIGTLPRVAIAFDGSAIAAWLVSGSVVGSRFQPGVGWEAPMSLGLAGAERVEVGIDQAGNGVVVGAVGPCFMPVRYLVGTGWTAPELINTDEDLGQVSVAHDGTAVALAQNGASLRASFRHPTGPWRAPKNLTDDAHAWDVVVRNGRAFAVWVGDDVGSLTWTPPVTTLLGTPTTVDAGTLVDLFTLSMATTPGAFIESHEWFLDGATDPAGTASAFEFRPNATTEVRLLVTDDWGYTAAAGGTVTVNSAAPGLDLRFAGGPGTVTLNIGGNETDYTADTDLDLALGTVVGVVAEFDAFVSFEGCNPGSEDGNTCVVTIDGRNTLTVTFAPP